MSSPNDKIPLDGDEAKEKTSRRRSSGGRSSRRLRDDDRDREADRHRQRESRAQGHDKDRRKDTSRDRDRDKESRRIGSDTRKSPRPSTSDKRHSSRHHAHESRRSGGNSTTPTASNSETLLCGLYSWFGSEEEAKAKARASKPSVRDGAVEDEEPTLSTETLLFGSEEEAKAKARASAGRASNPGVRDGVVEPEEEAPSRPPAKKKPHKKKSKRSSKSRSSAAAANGMADAPNDPLDVSGPAERSSKRQSEQQRLQEEEKKRRRKKMIICFLVLFTLIGLGVGVASIAWFFGFLKMETTAAGPSAPVEDAAPSGTPTSSPSDLPSSTPTFFDLYEAPNEDFCLKVSQNRTTAEDRAGLDRFSFDLTIDVTLEVVDDMTGPQVFTLAEAIQEKLAPRLIGCDLIRRTSRNLETGEGATIRGVVQNHQQRQLLLGADRFIIKDAFVKGKQVEGDCTKTQFATQCHRVFVELTVFLRGPIRMIDIIFLISEKVEQQLKEEGVVDDNLKEPLQLEFPFFTVKLTDIASMSPTTAPTQAPTQLPSVPPSSVPSESPSTPAPVDPNVPPPTAKPVVGDDEDDGRVPSLTLTPTMSPSQSPSLYPTLAPSPGPTLSPTLRPTAVPTASPSISPSLAPVIGPSPPPSTSPSRIPSMSPTLGATGAASGVPTLNPSQYPSSKPSFKASSSPSDKPSTIPSASPSKYPSPQPSASPSSRPSPSPLTCFCSDADACTGTTLPDFTIGCGSCNVANSCKNLVKGSPSTIGQKSCTFGSTENFPDASSCNGATINSIGVTSCTGENSCRGRVLTVGTGSCTGRFSCDNSGDQVTDYKLTAGAVGALIVGGESCTGTNACLAYSGTVGNRSCRGERACAGRTFLTIGNNSCQKQDSCSSNFVTAAYGSLAVGAYSCRGINACLSYSGLVAVGGTSGEAGSCRGENACIGRSVLAIAQGSCLGASACSGYTKNGNDYEARAAPEMMTVGKGSCNCDQCCMCMKIVLEGKCNALGECCKSQDPSSKVNPFPADVGVAI